MPKLDALRDKASGNILMRNPDGKAYAVPDDAVQEAMSQGWQLESVEQAVVREYVDDNKGLSGSLKVFGGQLVDEAGLGLAEMIYDRTADPLEVAKKQGLKEDHNLANVLGGVSGAAASLVYGGPAWKAVAKGGQAASNVASKVITKKLIEQGIKQGGAKGIAKELAGKTLNKAAQLGTEGVLVSAPYAITEAALAEEGEGFKLAAESLAAGGLLGAGLGITIPGAARMAKAIAKPAKAIAKSVYDPLSRKIKPREAVLSLYAPSPTDVEKLTKRWGADVQDDILRITKDKLGLDASTVDAANMSEKVQRFISKTKNEIDDLAKNATGTIDSFDLGNRIKAKLNESINSLSKGSGGRTAIRQIRTELQDIEDRFLRNNVPLSAEDLLEYKRATGGNVRYGKDPATFTGREEALDKAVKTTDEVIGEMVEKSQLDPSSKSIWRDKNKEASIMISLAKPLGKKIGKDANRPLTSVGNIVSTAGVASIFGGLPGAVAGFAMSPVMSNQRTWGILYAENAMNKVAKALDDIPIAIKRQIQKGKGLASNKLTEMPRQKAIYGTVRLLGNTQEERVKEYERIQKRSIELNDPAYAASEVGQVTSILSSTGAPQIANDFARKNAVMAKYFSDTAPKPKTPDKPYYKQKYVPNDMELSEFERRLEVVQNPFSVIEDLEEGTLTETSVDALRNIYPRIYQRIQEKVIETLMDTDEDIPYETRLQLALLLGEPTDPSLENISMFQRAYTPESVQGDRNQKVPGLEVPNLQTDVQRISEEKP